MGACCRPAILEYNEKQDQDTTDQWSVLANPSYLAEKTCLAHLSDAIGTKLGIFAESVVAIVLPLG